MSPMAEVIAIDTVPPMSPSKRAEYLSDQWHAAARALDKALHAARVLPNPFISPGARAEQNTGVHGLRCHEWRAVFNLTGYFERRIRQLERMIRTVLASDALSEDQRHEMLSGVYGKAAAERRDGSLLSDTERQLVDRYRDMDPAGKQMLRTLCARLAVSSTDTKGGAG